MKKQNNKVPEQLKVFINDEYVGNVYPTTITLFILGLPQGDASDGILGKSVAGEFSCAVKLEELGGGANLQVDWKEDPDSEYSRIAYVGGTKFHDIPKSDYSEYGLVPQGDVIVSVGATLSPNEKAYVTKLFQNITVDKSISVDSFMQQFEWEGFEQSHEALIHNTSGIVGRYPPIDGVLVKLYVGNRYIGDIRKDDLLVFAYTLENGYFDTDQLVCSTGSFSIQIDVDVNVEGPTATKFVWGTVRAELYQKINPLKLTDVEKLQLIPANIRRANITASDKDMFAHALVTQMRNVNLETVSQVWGWIFEPSNPIKMVPIGVVNTESNSALLGKVSLSELIERLGKASHIETSAEYLMCMYFENVFFKLHCESPLSAEVVIHDGELIVNDTLCGQLRHEGIKVMLNLCGITSVLVQAESDEAFTRIRSDLTTEWHSFTVAE